MKPAAERSDAGLLPHISSNALLFAMLLLATTSALGLSALVLAGAARSNRDLTASVDTRVLRLLEREGLSGLAAEIDRLGGALAAHTGEMNFTLWRIVNGQDQLIRETRAGLADAIADVQSHKSERRIFDGQPQLVRDVNVAEASRDWDLPMGDVRISYAMALPTARTRSARRELAAVWGGFILAVAIGLVLHNDHRRRYRNGLDRINAVLDDFAAGNTSTQVTIETGAPELRRLSDHLCQVLPQLDRLLNDLRALTAHLAHELRTPLQTIRTDVDRMAVSDEPERRRQLARDIDITIDTTDARLRSVMQLFRLSSDVHVPVEPGVDLGELVTDQVYDFEEALIAGNRDLQLDIAKGVTVAANRSLMELLVGNLLSNAGKYALDGARIGVELTRTDTTFELKVWNTGSRFPENWIGRPIQRLTRADSHQNIPGHGLGLALVEVIARHHGYMVALENAGPEGHATVVMRGPCDHPD